MENSFTSPLPSFCWANGKVTQTSKSKILSTDHAVIVGDGVFETLKVINQVPFALTRHLRRLHKSSMGLGLPNPDDATIKSAITDTLAMDPDAGLLRITWSSGPGPLGSSRGKGLGSLLVATSPGVEWPESERVHLCKWTRNENGALVGLKTTSYAENVKALHTAFEHGASEALLANTAGYLCEGTGTNVFLVIDGILVTPPLTSGCLAGITRELIMELTHVVERNISPEEFTFTSEAFLTSSTREISPIFAFDKALLPDAPGPITKEISAIFKNLIKTNLDP